MKKKMMVLMAAILGMALGFSACSKTAEESEANSGGTAEAPIVETPDTEQETSGEPVELVVFAAASMTETLTEIADLYKEVAPNVTLTYTFDSSGTLKTQIEEGADCDIFISAAQKQMNGLEEGEYLAEDTRVNILENKVVLVVPEGNPANIQSFADLSTDKLHMIALGNDDVPVGQYSNEILGNLGIKEALENNQKITYGSNVKEVTTQVSETSVDCGIIYATDAFSSGLTIVDEADEALCGRVIYPAAVLKNTKRAIEAKDFLAYLQSEDSGKIFESVGFSVVK